VLGISGSRTELSLNPELFLRLPEGLRCGGVVALSSDTSRGADPVWRVTVWVARERSVDLARPFVHWDVVAQAAAFQPRNEFQEDFEHTSVMRYPGAVQNRVWCLLPGASRHRWLGKKCDFSRADLVL